MLKQEYKEGEMNLNDALLLAIKTLSKTLDMTKITADKGMVNSLFDLAEHTCLRVLYKIVEFFSACTCIFSLLTNVHVHILKYMYKYKLVNIADKSTDACTTYNCN